MFGTHLLLFIIIKYYKRMFDQIIMVLPLVFIMLQAMAQEQNTFKSKVFFAGFTEIIATFMHFILKFRSIFSVEWGLSVKKFE